MKRFGRVTAVDGVSLSAPRGQVLGLLGPNGAGKTTVVRVLATLLRPDSGRAWVAGADLVRNPALVRRRIALCGQHTSVDGELSGLANLVMIGRLLDLRPAAARARAAELVSRFDLEEAADRRVATYSGGMRRRLDLAAGLVGRPEVVFLDEPTAGLDPAGRDELWRAVGDLTRDGVSILLTTQHLEEADALADTLAVIDHGADIAAGTPADLKRRVGGHTVVLLLTRPDDVAPASAVLARVTGEEPRLSRGHRARRSLVKSGRNPGPIVNGVVTPVLFLILFLSLFSRPVAGSTGDYLQYLFPGIVVMGAGLTGLVSTGTAISIDLRNGVTDRFRSLPISRLAPLLGSVAADVVRYLFAVAFLSALGTLLGFRVPGGVSAAMGSAGLAILFGFCLSWVTVFVGVLVRSADAVLAVSFVAFLPLQLGSSLATPIDTLPGRLRGWAEVNPVTHVMDASRSMLNGVPAAGAVGWTLFWSGLLLVVFCPLAVLAYGRRQ